MNTPNKLKKIFRETVPWLYPRLQEILTSLRTRYVTRVITSETGWVVQKGPFTGMRYVPRAVGSTLPPKLLGSYEAELHPTIDVILKNGYKTVIDVGCAEGYYAIGLALKLPLALVHAFDINPKARELCRQMAVTNRVEARVIVHDECSHESLRDLITPLSLIVCDCEGCELELLQPSLVRELAGCDLLVELHDLLRPGLTAALLSRFMASHEITLITTQDRNAAAYPILQKFSTLNQRVALAESRDGEMQWAFMTSKNGTEN